jgi:hypothetical protein
MEVTKYVDPATGSHWIVNGNAQRVSAKLGRVAALLMMKRGSVPGSRFFNCGIRDITKGGPLLPKRIEAEIDKALRPWKTTPTRDGLYDSYSRRAWTEGGVTRFTVTIRNGGTTATSTFPFSPSSATSVGMSI